MEEIRIPIYYSYNDEGEVIIDTDSMADDFNIILNEVLKNPQDFLDN